MGRYLITLRSRETRQEAHRIIDAAPDWTRVEIKDRKRTTAQSDRMWAMLTDVARQVVWHGKRLRPEDYKLVFLDGLKREIRAVPNLDGTGFVNLGQSSSDLSVSEMSDMIELIFKFGAEHGVVFADDQERAA